MEGEATISYKYRNVHNSLETFFSQTMTNLCSVCKEMIQIVTERTRST